VGTDEFRIIGYYPLLAFVGAEQKGLSAREGLRISKHFWRCRRFKPKLRVLDRKLRRLQKRRMPEPIRTVARRMQTFAY
jgi:hypothetical protein